MFDSRHSGTRPGLASTAKAIQFDIRKGDSPLSDIVDDNLQARCDQVKDERLSTEPQIQNLNQPITFTKINIECLEENSMHAQQQQKLDLTFNQIGEQKDNFASPQQSSRIMRESQNYIQNFNSNPKIDDQVIIVEEKKTPNSKGFNQQKNLNLQLTDTFSQYLSQTMNQKSSQTYEMKKEILVMKDIQQSIFEKKQQIIQTVNSSTIKSHTQNININESKRGSKENIASTRYKECIKDYSSNPEFNEKKYQEMREKQLLEICNSYQTHNNFVRTTDQSNLKNNDESKLKQNILSNLIPATSKETKVAQELLLKTLYSSQTQNKISRGAFSPQKMSLDQQYMDLLRRPSSHSTYSSGSQNINNFSSNKQNISSNLNNNSSAIKTSDLNQKSNLIISANNVSAITPNNHSSQAGLGCSSSRVDRLAYERVVLEEKKKQLQQKQLEQEMKECTFQPNLKSSRSKSKNVLLDSNFQLVQSIYPNEIANDFVKKQEILSQRHDSIQKQMIESSLIQLESTIQEKPKLNRKSQRLANELNKENIGVIDRLYCSNTSQQQKNSSSIKRTTTPHQFRDNLMESQELYNQEQLFFQPQISERAHNIIRSQRVDILLYDDAQRRQKQQEDLQQSRSRSKSSSNTNRPSTGQSSATNLLTSQIQSSSQSQFILGFIKEFASVVQTNLHPSEYYSQQNNTDTLIFVEMVQVLKALRFIALTTYETNKQHIEVCQQIWCYLRGDEKGYILKRNLQLFLLAVMNIYDKKGQVPKLKSNSISNILQNHLMNSSKSSEIKIFDHFQSTQSASTNRSEKQNKSSKIMVHSEVKSQNKYSQHSKSESYFDEMDNLVLSQEEVHQIHQKHKLLYVNRLSSQNLSPYHSQQQQSLVTQKEQEARSRSPQINQNSQYFAQCKRQKLMFEVQQKEPQRTTIDLASLLSFQKEKTQLELEQIRKKNIEEELNQCTFKPQVGISSPLQRKMSQQSQMFQDSLFQKKNSQPNLYHRSLHLYSLAKPQTVKRDRDVKDIEYEKECDQCTFQPETNLKRVNSPVCKKQMPYNINSIQKNVDRLYSARIQNKIKEVLINSGNTVSKTKFKKTKETVSKGMKQAPQNLVVAQNSISSNQENTSDKGLNSFTSLFQQRQLSQPCLIPTSSQLFKQEDLSNGQISPQVSSLSECMSLDSLHTYVQPGSTKRTIDIEEKVPQLFVDVNIEEGKSARIIVYEGDRSEDLSVEFARQFDLDESMRLKLKDLLDQQINSLLHKIEEVSANEDEEEEEDHQNIQSLKYSSRSGQKHKTTHL